MSKELTVVQKNALKKRIISAITAIREKNVQDVSNYAINRLAAKTFNLTIFWKGKTLKGDARFVRIGLGQRMEVVTSTIGVMEDLLEEASKYDIMDDIMNKEDVKKVDGWGAE